MPAVHEALKTGALVADVGCGRGRVLVKLANASPNSRFVATTYSSRRWGAAGNSREAGVEDRITFGVREAAHRLPDSFDVITTFDVIHDVIDPLAILRSIRAALRPNGREVCLDINASHRLEENAGPLGAMFYSFSVRYCMTTSLAHGGEGLGGPAGSTK